MNQVTQLGFSSPSPLGCESAFYSLMASLSAPDNELKFPRVNDPHSDTRNDFTDLIRQTVRRLSTFCSLPYQSGSPKEFESSTMEGDLVRTGSGNTTVGLAFRICHIDQATATSAGVNKENCKTHDVGYVTLNSELKFVKGISRKEEHPYNHRNDVYRLSNLIRTGPEDASLLSPDKTGLYQFEGKKAAPDACTDECDCHNTLLGYTGLHGMSEKVGRFIVEGAGGIEKLCGLPNIHTPINAKELDSSLYLGSPLMRKGFSLILRLCQTGFTTNKKTVCFSNERGQRADPQVASLSNLIGRSFSVGRSKNPYFAIAHISPPHFRDVELELIKPSRKWSLHRSFNESDFEPFQQILNQNFSKIEGFSQMTVEHGSLGQFSGTIIHAPIAISHSAPVYLQLDQKND